MDRSQMYEIKIKHELVCKRCRALLDVYEVKDSSLETQTKIAGIAMRRFEAHAKACPDVRIESYIAETFQTIEECKGEAAFKNGSSYPMRSFNLGRFIPYGSAETTEGAQRIIADRVLQNLQAIFGSQNRGEVFYWRERPNFSAWIDPFTRRQHIALWMTFGIEGWAQDLSLSGFLGDSSGTSEFFRLEQDGECGGTNYLSKNGVLIQSENDNFPLDAILEDADGPVVLAKAFVDLESLSLKSETAILRGDISSAATPKIGRSLLLTDEDSGEERPQ